MVAALAFVATAIASLFAEATLVRWSQRRTPQLAAWTIALAMFALAAAALALGVSIGWDTGTFRAFYLLGAVLNVPWLALGTIALLARPAVTARARSALLVFSGLATGVLLSAPMEPVRGSEIPVGKDVLDTLPRVLAAFGSGVGALVILGGAGWSALRALRARRDAAAPRVAAANGLIALGTLVLSSGGLVQGAVGHDEAFTISLVVGITVIYAGFLVTRSLPERERLA